MSNESKSICSDCELPVTKEFLKFHQSAGNGNPAKRRKKYKDETGRLWHGTRCPDCATKWRKGLAQDKSNKIQEELKKQIGE